MATQTCSLTSLFIYIFIHFHSNQGTGQQCCYNEIGDLIVGPRNGGSLDRVHVEAGVPALSHFFHDIVPYWDCCMLSDNCKKYFEKRPSNDGAKYIPPKPGMKPAEVPRDGVHCALHWLCCRKSMTVPHERRFRVLFPVLRWSKIPFHKSQGIQARPSD